MTNVKTNVTSISDASTTTATTSTTKNVAAVAGTAAAAVVTMKVLRRVFVVGVACALAIVCALVALTTQAYANDGMSWEESEVRAQAANAGLDPDAAAASWAEGAAADSVHYEGEPVTISPGNGGKDVYAEWHMVDGEWVATFVTYNGNEVVARPEANEIGWTFWVSDNGTSVQVVRTAEEGAGANTESHWQEVYGIKRY